ncbi:hypothetical protein GCM10023322_68620 [Rugosimonospora acidiphila]|uniref:SAF domain-containing protein n=1 Tax=Rugosimonospora acidiphila TaxID=556531 RepID=A0ABP9SMM4_9ACTN
MDRPGLDARAPDFAAPVDTTGVRPRRSVGRLVAGLLLAAVMALVFVMVSQRTDHKVPVLAVTRSVAAGQRLTAADLVAVRVAVEAGVPVVPADQLGGVVGHTAVVPLVRGALLAPRQIGQAAWPPAGQAEVALPVKAGHVPMDLQPGATVMVLISPAATSGATSGAQTAEVRDPATVVAVAAASDGSGAQLVSLLVTQDAGLQLAGASSGDVSLVLLAPRG